LCVETLVGDAVAAEHKSVAVGQLNRIESFLKLAARARISKNPKKHYYAQSVHLVLLAESCPS